MASFEFSSLNGEILEIFSRLPAKSLVRFQSACKDAKSYLSETFFLNQHCHNMLANGDSGFLLVHPHDQVELFSSNSSNNHAYFGVPTKSVEFLASTKGIMASSNGLVCGRVKSEQEAPLFICNPATKSWVSIPSPSGWNSANMEIKVVFECLNCQDYVLMIIAPDTDADWSQTRHLTKIYSPKEGGWKEGGQVNFGSRNMHGRPLFINSNSEDGGAVYFMSDSGPYLASTSPYYWPYVVRYIYDAKTSISQFLKIPKDARKGVQETDCILNIFKWEQSDHGVEPTICLIKLRKRVFSVWVLEKSTWRMVFKRPAWVMGLFEPNLTVADFTVLNGNMLIIATAERMYRYDLTGDARREKAQIIYDHGCGRSKVTLHPYSNTLRPCGDGARPLPV